jgi:hypothetical protein
VKLYLSGPMTGIPDYNRPAFEQAAFDLRSRGFEVVSPIELDHNAGTSHDSETGFDFTHEEWEQFLERDYEALQGCAAICLINGWEKSGGAGREGHYAMKLGLPLLRYYGFGHTLVVLPYWYFRQFSTTERRSQDG